MNVNALRDPLKLVELIEEHRRTCSKTLCSPTFAQRGDEPVITDCRELSELPGYQAGECCCGLDFCPGAP